MLSKRALSQTSLAPRLRVWGGLPLMLALFCVAAFAYNPLPALEPPATLGDLRPPAPWPSPEASPARGKEPPTPLTAHATAREHIEALKNDPLHQKQFFVQESVGNLDSTRLIFFVPQFHRNQVMPIAWTSLGEEIINIQNNIDAVTTRLVKMHGTECIATEGSWQQRIELPFELQKSANWNRDLHRAQKKLLELKASARFENELKTLTEILEKELARFARIADGVGMAQSRFSDETAQRVRRFGVEDRALNQEGVALLAELKEINDRLGRLTPDDRSVVEDIMQEMWLLEIDDYEKETLSPLRQAMATLDKERIRVRQVDAPKRVERLGRYLSLAKHVVGAVIKLDSMDAHTEYFREIQALLDAGKSERQGETDAKPLVLSPAEEKEKEQLLEKREERRERYSKITLEARDKFASQKVLSHVGQNESCLLVFGMGHKEGILAAFKEQAESQDFAAVVIEPYDLKALAGE